MPWCDDCDRFLSPNTVNEDGTCPTCGSKIARPASIKRARKGRGSGPDSLAVQAEAELDGNTPVDRPQGAAETAAAKVDDHKGPPWHFWLLLVALVLYLSWRLIQGIVWITHKI